ncbi:MAG: winged helix-turn-helix transcriptional regulator [Thermoplasmatota archaeon]
MDPIRPLRDRTQTTRLLILALLQAEPGATLSGVAERLGVTVQAVSAHARALAAQGMVAAQEGAYRPTPRGLQALHEGVRQLRDAMAALAAPLDVIQVASAVAAAPVRAGQEVGLWMADGDLEARPNGIQAAASRGVARNAAAAGQEVIVSDLKGMVKLEPGPLRVVSMPAPAEGGVARVDVRALARELATGAWAKVGAHGTGARILARGLAKAGMRPADFEFAADRAAFNAAERGLATLLLVSRDRLAEVMQAFERLNAATLRRVPVEIVEAPELSA